MGSTRRTQLNRKNEEETDNTDETKESEFNAEIDMRNLDKMDAGELLLTIDVSENETAQPLFSAVHKQQETDEATSVPSSTESNVTPVKDFKAPLPKQSTSLNLKSKRYDVVMIGDSSVGKTSFMKRAQSGKFSLDLPASIGLDSLIWPVVVDGKPLVLQLWDTAGQERFHSITKQVFHKAQAFLLMYDITSTKSFSAVSYWANCIQESAAENVIVLLLGNKNDCSQRQVKTHQGEILAKEYDFEFMECSAATGENVIQSLEIVARYMDTFIIQRIDTREEATVLHKEPEQKKSSRCC
uniref:RAB44, member RAS oncogene family n=1 Tax=Amphilophus citrinellus TaxID=61819 RepID=A0A3Q0SDK6_AMPCI